MTDEERKDERAEEEIEDLDASEKDAEQVKAGAHKHIAGVKYEDVFITPAPAQNPLRK
jgi:hypothetical protein